MKKLIAMILGASMVLSLAACTSSTQKTRTTRETTEEVETTEDTTSKTTEESTTEESTTEESTTEESTTESTTEKPTEESTTESTEESTSETSDTTAAPTESETTSETTTKKDPSKPLENLESTIYYRRDGVNLMDTSGDEPGYGFVSMECPYLLFQNPNYKDLESKIFDDVFNPWIKISQTEYDKAVENLNQKKLAGESLYPTYCDYSIDRFRMDSEVVSFAICDGSEAASYTYDAQTKTQLTLSDLFRTDKDFFKVIEKRITATEMGEENVKTVMDQLKSDNPVFGITYDGILLPDPRGMYREDWFKISIVGMEDQVNMAYFGSTPEFYTLFFDANQTLEWDVTGDGKVDTVKFDFAVENADLMKGKLCVDINGKSFEFDKLSDDVSIGTNDKRAFVMRTDDGFYLYCTCGVIEGYEDTYIFKIGDGKLTYVDYVDFFFTDTTYIDPNNFPMFYRSGVITPHSSEADFSVLGCHGFPTTKSDFFRSYELGLITKSVMYAYTVDENLNSVEGFDLPAETSLAIVAYNPQKQTIILQTMSPTSDNEGHVMYLLQMVFKDDGTTIIGGCNLEDAFYGIEEMYY